MSDCHIWFGVLRSKNRGRVMLCWCFFREGTINDSSPSVRRTVSGLALRKNARFKRWEIRLTPKRGSRFLISTIFSRTGPGSFRRRPAGTTPFRSPASPRSSYAFVQRRITFWAASYLLTQQRNWNPFFQPQLHTTKFKLESIPLPVSTLFPFTPLLRFFYFFHGFHSFLLLGVSPIYPF